MSLAKQVLIQAVLGPEAGLGKSRSSSWWKRPLRELPVADIFSLISTTHETLGLLLATTSKPKNGKSSSV